MPSLVFDIVFSFFRFPI